MIQRHPIRAMPPHLALKIAAGEVVERPASAVKELLDNAIDAGATTIRVEVREAGLKLIRVTDNGCGIPRDELPLAFTSHATSKIVNLDDLERLTTLGFRGEALPSVAAVARVEVQTWTGEELVGARFVIEHGEEIELSPCSAPQGTRVSIHDLFGNVPARRKFVRSLRAETGQIGTLLSQYAMAHPNVQFSLTLDGRVTFTSPGTGRISDAFAAVYGTEALGKMIAVQSEDRGIRVSGLISSPHVSRSNRVGIHVYVNGRWVNNRSLVFAYEEAYSGYLMTGRHPMAALHLQLDPAEVDANIHPSKAEVRFVREREVHSVLHHAAANALLEARLRERGLAGEIDAEPVTSEESSVSQPSIPMEVEEQQIPLMTGLPALRVFGQANATFIIAEGPRGLYMIDQHAAHERILFDQLDLDLEQRAVQSQPLLEAASLDLTPQQMEALEVNADLLHDAGFVLEPFGQSACLIRAVPALTRSGSPTELVIEVLGELENLTEPAAARERALAAMACRAAVKAGATLDVAEMRELVAQLERTPRPATCPHGRPTMIHLSHTQLEREFGRR